MGRAMWGDVISRSLLSGLLLVAAGVWAPLSGQTVRGLVTDESTKAPVVDAVIRLLTEQRVEMARAVSDSTGRFTFLAPRQGRYRVRFEKLGYRPVLTQPFQLRFGETAEYELQVTALAPFTLDTVTVEGRLVPPVKLAGFYRRREQGFGEFITRQEFETWYPQVTTDIIRHAPVFNVRGPEDRPVIESRRRPGAGFGLCPPLIYLDDARMGNAVEVNINDALFPEAIEALEFYDGVQVPLEYQSNGSNCGVILVWSRVPGGEPGIARHLEIGGQLGGQVAGAGFQDGRLGAQVSIGLASVFEFYPAFNVFVHGWEGSGPPRSGWQALVSLRARPLGVDSPWYVGAGFTTIDREQGSAGFREGWTEDHAVLLTGLRLSVGWARPVVEVQLLDPTHLDGASVLVFTGLTVRLW